MKKVPPQFFVSKNDDIPTDATAEDRCRLGDMEGWMSKQSGRGFWQSRYFGLNNGYLNYYKDKSRSLVLGSLDLSKVCAIPVVTSVLQ